MLVWNLTMALKECQCGSLGSILPGANNLNWLDSE